MVGPRTVDLCVASFPFEASSAANLLARAAYLQSISRSTLLVTSIRGLTLAAWHESHALRSRRGFDVQPDDLRYLDSLVTNKRKILTRRHEHTRR